MRNYHCHHDPPAHFYFITSRSQAANLSLVTESHEGPTCPENSTKYCFFCVFLAAVVLLPCVFVFQ